MRSFWERTRQTAESRSLGGGDGFHVLHAAEEHRDPLIHDQEDAALALLGIDAAVRFACARTVAFQSICRMSSPGK